jgi:hypothetical protein
VGSRRNVSNLIPKLVDRLSERLVLVMFERYNEKARRLIFFARYEASQRGSAYIELEDLLLGALRGDPIFKTALSHATAEQLRSQLKSINPESHRPTTTSVDLPIGKAARQALRFGAEEAERLGHRIITPGHLVIGVLRQTDSPAAMAFEAAGLGLERLRELVGQAPAADTPRPPRGTSRIPQAISPQLSPLVTSLFATISTTTPQLYHWLRARFSEPVLSEEHQGEEWTRAEALGHLVDLAIAHQHWIAAALAQGTLHAENVPRKAWVVAQKYAEMDSTENLDLFVCVNRHLLNVMAAIPEDKLAISCQIAEAEPVSLEKLIAQYVDAVSEWLRKVTAS